MSNKIKKSIPMKYKVMYNKLKAFYLSLNPEQ
jgi:hypothetical protein